VLPLVKSRLEVAPCLFALLLRLVKKVSKKE
jgi:hypothetical protein